MSDSESQTSNQTSGAAQGEVLDELRSLGRNLSSLLQSAWESEERKKLQQEIESGLNEMGKSLKGAAEGPTGQAIKADLEDLHQRMRTGEVEQRLRSELVAALHAANEAIKKASEKMGPPPSGSGS